MNMSRLPKVGLRMIKSAAAVFLCLLLNMARQGQGAVFYSCIAAVLCMQQHQGRDEPGGPHADRRSGWHAAVGG